MSDYGDSPRRSGRHWFRRANGATEASRDESLSRRIGRHKSFEAFDARGADIGVFIERTPPSIARTRSHNVRDDDIASLPPQWPDTSSVSSSSLDERVDKRGIRRLLPPSPRRRQLPATPKRRTHHGSSSASPNRSRKTTTRFERDSSVPSSSAWRLDEEEEDNFLANSTRAEDTPFVGTHKYFRNHRNASAGDIYDTKQTGNSRTRLTGLAALVVKQLKQKRDADKMKSDGRRLDSSSSLMTRSASMEQLPGCRDRDVATPSPPLSEAGRSWSIRRHRRKSADNDLQLSLQSFFSIRDKSVKKHAKASKTLELLFEAIETRDVEKATMLLEDSNLPLNEPSEKGHTALDWAIMMNFHPIVYLLLSKGARENPKVIHIKGFRSLQLEKLTTEAERHVAELTGVILNSTAAAGTGSSNSSLLKNYENMLRKWQWRKQVIKTMQQEHEKADLPDQPAHCTAKAESKDSLRVKWSEPQSPCNAAITQYKVEWSKDCLFDRIGGSLEKRATGDLTLIIKDLKRGTPYYIRVSAYNVKGFGPPCYASPPFAIPSSWQDVNDCPSRMENRCAAISNLSEQLRETREAGLVPGVRFPSASPQLSARRMSKSLSKLFSASSAKYVKKLKRGVYFGALFYTSHGKILVNDDQIPLVEVDDTYSSTFGADFYWLMKLSYSWKDVQNAHKEISQTSTSSSVQFRHRLLASVLLLQSLMSVTELGLLHYEPIRDSETGSTVILTVHEAKDTRQVPSLKWTSQSKFERKVSVSVSAAAAESPTGNGVGALDATNRLYFSLKDVISFNEKRKVPVERGLYLGYLKANTFVDALRVFVEPDTPSMLPCVKVRSNPSVLKDEWKAVRKLIRRPISQSDGVIEEEDEEEEDEDEEELESGREFVKSLLRSALELFTKLGIPSDKFASHRLLGTEVMELNSSVSVLLILPSSDDICIIPGHSTKALELKNMPTLPLPVLEIIQWHTYQKAFLKPYCKLSSSLETDFLLAQIAQRGAFSKQESKNAQSRLDHIIEFQQKAEEIWRPSRWIADALQWARDRQSLDVISFETIQTSVTSALGLRRRQSERENGTNSEKKQDKERRSSNENLGTLKIYPPELLKLRHGTSVKLQLDDEATSVDIVRVVVEQLKRHFSDGDSSDLSLIDWRDFYLVMVVGSKERPLHDEFQPLRLQNPWIKGKLCMKLKVAHSTPV
ncbi:ankyrin repeat and fibronectin type-III domain-containing protein 1-like isoform X2 [Oscarella lobularis]|uniref:ankyrin repeat and fibronectin type-III domain-containing protein 1-like isoform X2 n=1 Tax=Oscarella lobularis TaxID=121494 RepID=UPI003313DE9E